MAIAFAISKRNTSSLSFKSKDASPSSVHCGAEQAHIRATRGALTWDPSALPSFKTKTFSFIKTNGVKLVVIKPRKVGVNHVAHCNLLDFKVNVSATRRKARLKHLVALTFTLKSRRLQCAT